MKRTANLLLVFTYLFSFYAKAQCLEGDCSSGYGTYKYEDGDVYEGYWENGSREGWGTYLYKEGDVYAGLWKAGEKHYFGAYYWKDGDYYMGLWKNNEREKHGVYVWANGTSENRVEKVYYSERGCVYGDCTNGFGIYIWDNGDLHAGFWKDGKQQNLGIKFWGNDKDFFYGLYKDGGRKPKRGYYVYEDATARFDTEPVVSTFSNSGEGCLYGNCNDGFGVYRWKSGSMHAGFWKNGRQHYLGFRFWEDGDFFIGLYNNGDRKTQKRGLYVWDDGDHEFYAQKVRYNAPKASYVQSSTYSNSSFNTGSGSGTTGSGSASNTPGSLGGNSSQTKVWAIVVGVADYNHINSLRYTDDDAYKLAMFLKSPEGGAVPDEQMRVLIDENATRDNILSQLQSLSAKAGTNDLLMFYFSGHGVNGAFLPSDFDGYNGKLGHNDIRSVFASSKAKHKLIIADACHSGSYEKGLKSAEVSNVLDSYYTALNNSSGGTALMMSSKAEETSIEFQGLRQGIFSYYLIKGLKGEADQNSDKIITINELYNFTSSQVRNYTRNRQSPVINGSYDRNMPVGVLRR